jgi:hypothetical protein
LAVSLMGYILLAASSLFVIADLPATAPVFLARFSVAAARDV